MRQPLTFVFFALYTARTERLQSFNFPGSLRNRVDDLFFLALHDRVRQRKPGALREADAFEHGATSEHSLRCGWRLPYLRFIKNGSKGWKLKICEDTEGNTSLYR